MILDGKTGNKLWSLNTTMTEYSSDLVLKTKSRNRDAFLFRVRGIFKSKKKDEKDAKENQQREVRAIVFILYINAL